MEPPKPKSNRPRSEVKGHVGFAPPQDIQVPNRQLYVTRRGQDFLLFQGLEPLHDEGWKLHVTLPANLHLCPPVVFLCRKGTRYKITANRYYAQPEEERKGDRVEKILVFQGYANLFIYLQKKAVPHKFYPTLDVLKKMKQHNEDQKGKFLTIYPSGEKEMKKIISQIDQCLHEMILLKCFEGADFAGGDKKVGAHQIVTARYGVLTIGEGVLKKTGDIVGEINATNNSCYLFEDTYKKITYKPDHIRDPWGETSSGEDGWYDHPRNRYNRGLKDHKGVFSEPEFPSREGMVYDSKARRWVKSKK